MIYAYRVEPCGSSGQISALLGEPGELSSAGLFGSFWASPRFVEVFKVSCELSENLYWLCLTPGQNFWKIRENQPN